MGGVHACMVASLYPFPIACVPLLAPRSAAGAYCQGVLNSATAWRPLLESVDEKQQAWHVSLASWPSDSRLCACCMGGCLQASCCFHYCASGASCRSAISSMMKAVAGVSACTGLPVGSAGVISVLAGHHRLGDACSAAQCSHSSCLEGVAEPQAAQAACADRQPCRLPMVSQHAP